MTASEARVAADLASEFPIDHPLVRAAREILVSLVTEGQHMPDTIKGGTPLHDAAVDPRPGDFLPPINAGLEDPHGPLVRSIEVGTAEYQAAVDERRAEGGDLDG